MYRTFVLLGIIILLLTGLLVGVYFLNNNKSAAKSGTPAPSPAVTITTTPKGYTSIENSYDEPVILKDIITPQEAAYIMNYASDKFAASQMVGDFEDKSVRDSETCWIRKSDNVVSGITKRICKMVNKPFENAEDLQVVKYKPNGMYRPHHDACCDDNEQCNEFLKRGGQRVKTVVIYLTDDFEGGETNFPTLNKKYKPAKNSGILFDPLDTDCTTCHPKALHEGSPVTRGTKMICNVWIRESVFV
jgi:prolyl 4-hydroxylase